MRKHVFLGICLLGILGIILSCSTEASENYIKVDKIKEFTLEIGSIIPQSFLDVNQSSTQILASPSQTFSKYNVLVKGIKYEIGVDSEKTIAFISTSDENFSTPENIRVGMGLMEALQISHADMLIEKGWASYLTLKSGWNAAFKLQADNTFNINDSVAFVFMRKN